jgi:S1-C subfamily serine protease
MNLRVLVLLAAILSGTACQATNGGQAGAPQQSSPAATAAATAAPAVQPSTPSRPATSPAAGDFTTAIRQVAQAVRPAVVRITNEQVQLGQFNQPFTVPAGIGTGVIFDNQGHILTNNHVIEGAKQLAVSTPDGQTFQATVTGADPQTDLAVIQVQGQNLPMAKLGNSGSLQVGDWVVAIGNALGLPGGPTVSQGVVGALDRTVQLPDANGNPNGPFLFDVVQTDAAINPGNSGGPLVTLSGDVIGINTLVAALAEPGVPAQGIGFAIGIDAAKPIADQLITNGKVAHPFLGVGYVPINPALASQLGVNVRNGIVVARVVQGSPADGKLQVRDVITMVDNTQLQSESDLARVLNSHKPGDTITLTVLRGSQQSQVQITLGEMPAS